MPVDPETIRINIASGVPAYRQIADAVRTHLVAETLKPGDALPPVRRLAIDLGVHFNTVAEAYRILAEEGWLELRRRRGARVIDRRAPARPAHGERKAFARRLHQMVAEGLSQGIPKQEIQRNLHDLAKGLTPG